MKLISMTDFVLQENKGGQQVNSITSQLHHDLRRIKKYANFLKQPLKLEMFVPIDEDGNFLEEPEQFKEWIKSDHYFNASESVTHECRMYKKAKEKVLFLRFDGSEFDSSLAKVYLDCYFNIEQLSNEVKEQVLTENAIKQLGL
jgi:hypothetical protein